jgi:GAF domain-containing protein
MTRPSRRHEEDGQTQLADEQAALRRVATLVAHATPAQAVFAAVTAEVGQLLHADLTALGRYDRNLGRIDFVGTWNRSGDGISLGSGLALGGRNVATLVFETEAPARLDTYSDATGDPADLAARLGVRSMIGVPVAVERQLWGGMFVGSRKEPLPTSTERRLADFVELVAATIANAQAQTDLTRYAQEQAALRRVATLVAQGAPPSTVFEVTTVELSRLLNLPILTMVRFEDDGTATVVAAASDKPFPIGTNLMLDGPSVVATVLKTGRPARIESYEGLPREIAAGLRKAGAPAGYGVPIMVNGRLWGAMAVVDTLAGPRPDGVEPRLAEFTELTVAAISNAEARAELVASRARIVAAGVRPSGRSAVVDRPSGSAAIA